MNNINNINVNNGFSYNQPSVVRWAGFHEMTLTLDVIASGPKRLELQYLTGQIASIDAFLTAQPVKHTWRWLCTRYMGSAEFKQLAKSTRSQRASVLEATWDESLAPARRS